LNIVTSIRKPLKILFSYDFASQFYEDAKPAAQTLKEAWQLAGETSVYTPNLGAT
jgi:hypothetical protein